MGNWKFSGLIEKEYLRTSTENITFPIYLKITGKLIAAKMFSGVVYRYFRFIGKYLFPNNIYYQDLSLAVGLEPMAYSMPPSKCFKTSGSAKDFSSWPMAV